MLEVQDHETCMFCGCVPCVCILETPKYELDAVGFPILPRTNLSEMSEFDIEVEQQDQEIAQSR